MEKNFEKEEKENDLHLNDVINTIKKPMCRDDLIIFSLVILLVVMQVFTLFQWKHSIQTEQDKLNCFQKLSRQLIFYNDGTPSTWDQMKYNVKKDSPLGNVSTWIDPTDAYNKCIKGEYT